MIYIETDFSKIPVELFKQFSLLKQTLSLIKIAHQNQSYNGLPYWHHPVRVMLRLNWFKVQPSDVYAALLHDALEDTPLTEGDMRNFNYDDRTIFLVKGVTRNKDEETYKDFIARICGTRDVGLMRLKLADLYENSNNVRFLPPEKRTIMIRYGKSIRDVVQTLTDLREQTTAESVLSGELERQTVENWIGEQPRFL